MKKRFKYIGVIIGICLISFIFAFGQIFAVTKIEVYYAKTPIQAKTNEIIDASGLKLKTNIFSIDESVLINNVNRNYTDKSVSLIDVERVFPNRVIFHVKERIIVFAVPMSADSNYVITDESFARSTIVSYDDIDKDNLIMVTGTVIENTFNTPHINKINEVRKGFSHLGIEEEGLIAFVREIEILEVKNANNQTESINAIIYLRHYNLSYQINIINNEEIVDNIQEKYNEFLNLTPYSRFFSV